MVQLDGKAAIVTGGGSGIGRAIALEMARAGANVVVAGRTLINLQKTVDQIKAQTRRGIAVPTDIRKKEQAENLAYQTIREFDHIDILVNNAALIHPPVPIHEVEEEIWTQMMDTNLKGYLYCTQAVAKHMIKRRYGKIINITSMAALGIVTPGLGPYIISKTAIIGLTKVCAREFGPYGINVNCIAVGRVHTPITDSIRAPEEVKEYLEYGKYASILGRNGTPEDIANLAVFLASDKASFITGQVIHDDGGRMDRM